MAKTSTVVPRARPATGGANGRTGTRREMGESQGGARDRPTRRRFDWRGAPSPSPPGLSVEREGGGLSADLLGLSSQLPATLRESWSGFYESKGRKAA